LPIEVRFLPEVTDLVDQGPVVFLVRFEDLAVTLDEGLEVGVAEGRAAE